VGESVCEVWIIIVISSYLLLSCIFSFHQSEGPLPSLQSIVSLVVVDDEENVIILSRAHAVILSNQSRSIALMLLFNASSSIQCNIYVCFLSSSSDSLLRRDDHYQRHRNSPSSSRGVRKPNGCSHI
jgi:hypothetical protein